MKTVYFSVRYYRDRNVKQFSKRTRTYKMKKTKLSEHVGVRLTPDEYQILDDLAWQNRTTKSKFIRSLVRDHVVNKTSVAA